MSAVNRNPDVDGWFEIAAHPLEPALQRAREVILGVDDRITETIKWNTPTFELRGNIASFNPSKTTVSVMFHRGAEIPGRHPRLEGEGRLVRTMRFASLEEVEAGSEDLQRAVKAWCDWKAPRP
jgi:hypothetical protein